jgi:hypothetical protein
MKAILLYLVAAMAVMFTLPATAAEDYEGFAPVYSHAMPEIVAIDDSPMLAERSVMRQLEAADLYLSDIKPPLFDEDEGLFYVAAISGRNLPYEVGWRS